MQEIAGFLTVLVTDIVIACSIAALYSSGLRLWARGTKVTTTGSHITLRVASSLCFAACVAIVIYALWYMIPYFH